MYHRMGIFLSALCLTSQVFAADETAEWHLATDASIAHQTFEDSSAELRNLMLTPSVAWSNWQLNLTLPWQDVEGEYFVGSHQPSPLRLCKRFENITPARQLRWLKRGRITQDQLAACTADLGTANTDSNHAAGLGDIDAFATYGYPLDEVWLLSLGLGYKWDNGDALKGLGSGTREWRAEVAAEAIWQALTLRVTAGQTQVDNTTPEQEVANNYSYGNVTTQYALTKSLTLSAGAFYQQAYYPGGESPSWLRLGVNYKPLQKVIFTASVNQYQSGEEYPQQEWTLGVGYDI